MYVFDILDFKTLAIYAINETEITIQPRLLLYLINPIRDRIPNSC